MRRWIIAVIVELGVIVLALAGAGLSWRSGIHVTDFAPFGDSPGFAAIRYLAPWLLLAAVLVTVAGVFAVDATARLVDGLRGPAETGR
ncbi:hypothetical protein AB0B25_12950 [Nocardia sp. NPDC049190]|uniref:hypothetical protein n=1 Tax=Nocardia sp. NPDC049190 TaxID=3155650 RepID=UPI00340861D3